MQIHTYIHVMHEFKGGKCMYIGMKFVDLNIHMLEKLVSIPLI